MIFLEGGGGGGGGRLQPFQEYFTYIEPIVHQSWVKTGEPGQMNEELIQISLRMTATRNIRIAFI